MSIDLDSVGRKGEAGEREWTSFDSLLYSISVGAGLGAPETELEFTTENSTGVEQRALPSMIGVLLAGTEPSFGEVDMSKLLHGDQFFELHKPLPTAGSLRAQEHIASIWDKGSGALVTRQIDFTDLADGSPLATVRFGLFVRGEGGFGGPKQPKSGWELPERPPDHVVEQRTRVEQALLYRLTGDRNPLHADPIYAASSGYDRPILMGMCTYGFVSRALLSAVAGGDPDRFRSMYARFTHPVWPGDRLSTSIWLNDSGATFRTATQDGTIILDHGTMTLR